MFMNPKHNNFNGVLFTERGIPYKKNPFLMMETPVTQELYLAVMGENPSHFKGMPDSLNRPVEYLRWNDGIRFANALSTAMGLQPAYVFDPSLGCRFMFGDEYLPPEGAVVGFNDTNGYRLPFEAEWEYAAKGGKNHEYAGSDKLDEVGWYCENSGRETHPVRRLNPNGYGLYDMCGNVSEWCVDDYDNPGQRRSKAVTRVSRGGSCRFTPDWCRVSDRGSFAPGARFAGLGLRLCRSL